MFLSQFERPRFTPAQNNTQCCTYLLLSVFVPSVNFPVVHVVLPQNSVRLSTCCGTGRYSDYLLELLEVKICYSFYGKIFEIGVNGHGTRTLEETDLGDEHRVH